ncbi:MAG TPA: ribonuclease H [Bacteroidota bacterium]|nr:ribonuclease H [Bacteroidota bacterium]
MDNIIKIYCDGACSGNQNKNNIGGWGALLIFNEKVKKINGGEKNTTNQRMELTACIKALEAIKSTKYPIEIYTDSAYLYNCIQQKWYEKWEQNGWKNSKKLPIENKDLWEKLLNLIKKYNPTFIKVKGHSGDKYNDEADKLANIWIQKNNN